MMYATHKAGGALGMLLAYKYMGSKGLLIDGVEPMIQLLLMYPSASFGSTLPDLDHGWQCVKEKTPFNFAIHKLIHLTQPRHRSWQTHSLLVTGGFCLFLNALIGLGLIVYGETFSMMVLRLLVVGLTVGITSHLILDMMTMGGIQTIPGKEIRVVPRTHAFGTDTNWERLVFKILNIIIGIILGVEIISNIL